jgi:oxygen-independent coproporphyrinogen-3 oxidase
MSGPIVDRTVQAIVTEIRASRFAGRPAKTIFVGGGTPTFLSAGQITDILQAILDTHPPVADCEITSEGNPGTVDIPKFEAMRKAGFNRISLGAQSFQTEDLVRLGRVHAPTHIGTAVAAARRAGFENLNLDLMYALPGQSPAAWKINLETALALQPDHLSLYCLTIEQNTRYYKFNLRGMLDIPTEDYQTEMYDMACEMTSQAGFTQYEISNFSKPGRQCNHNIEYWRGAEYLAYGPGAVGAYDPPGEDRIRFNVLKHPERYSEAVEQGKPTWYDEERLTPAEVRFEQIMLGIRLNAGLSTTNLDLNEKGLEAVVSRGWVERRGEEICLTPAGRHFCSRVAVELA